MDWNHILKRTNDAIFEEKQERIDKEISKIEKLKKKSDTHIKNIKKETTVLYKLKSRFHKVLKYCLIIFGIWIIPAIYFLVKSNVMIFKILLIVYFILTLPVGVFAALIPMAHFLYFDIPKVLNEIKIFAGNKYIIAIFFMENRMVIPVLRKIDTVGHFMYEKGTYVTDKSATFLTNGKVLISFYLKGLPNPLKFNFRKYLDLYILKKSENPENAVKDWEGRTVDVAFSSENLTELKKTKFFQEFFSDAMAGANKVLFAVLGFASLAIVALVFMFMIGRS